MGLILVLPVPPSPQGSRHHMVAHQVKRAHQQEVWIAACAQHRPWRRPPPLVRVTPVFYLRNRRDADNLVGSLKFTLDALRQVQRGSVAWRLGVADLCGYFVDDDPRHIELVPAVQVIDRKRQRLELLIEGIEG